MYRTCIIGLPRTGSQLCEKLIASAFNNTMMLGTYFDGSTLKNFIQSDDIGFAETVNPYGQLDTKIVQFLESGNKTFASKKLIEDILEIYLKVNAISTDWKHRMAVLSKLDHTIPVTVRLFLNNLHEMTTYKEIVQDLRNIGFSFISLERNYESQVLSQLIARNYSMTRENIFSMDSVIKEPITVPVNLFTAYVIQFAALMKLNWGTYMKMLQVPIKRVTYENMCVDLKSVYMRDFTITGHKTIQGDPYQWITNSDEIKELIQPMKQLVSSAV